MCDALEASQPPASATEAVVMRLLSEEERATLGARFDRLFVHPSTAQIKALLTIIRNKDTPRSDWVFYADRLIRQVVEYALNFLPVTPWTVQTPVDDTSYAGVAFQKRIVGVSIVRGGEAMETALRSCCRNVRIGKILIQRDEVTAEAQLYFSKLPADIHGRHVLLLDPMVATGNSLLTAVRVLLNAGVLEEKIIVVALISALSGLRSVTSAHPKLTIVTAEVDPQLNAQKYIVPGCGDFGDRYFCAE